MGWKEYRRRLVACGSLNVFGPRGSACRKRSVLIRRMGAWDNVVMSSYPAFKGPAILYVLRIMPEGRTFVPANSSEQGGVPSAKKRFPMPSRTG